MTPYDEVKTVFEQNLTNGKLSPSAQKCFDKAFQRSIEIGLGNPDVEWGEAKDFVLDCTARIARRARKLAGEKDVKWKDVARALNCLVPDMQDVCYQALPSGKGREPFGEWCVELGDDFPEEPDN